MHQRLAYTNIACVFFYHYVMRRAATAAAIVVSVVFNQDEDKLTLKANRVTTAPDLILIAGPHHEVRVQRSVLVYS